VKDCVYQRGDLLVNDTIDRILRRDGLPNRILNESLAGAARILDDLISSYEGKKGFLISDIEFLREAQEGLRRTMGAAYAKTKMGVLVPVGVWGLTKGLNAPDLDISTLGIGNHRFFLFHSAIGLAVLQYLYRNWTASLGEEENKWSRRVPKKISGALLGSVALGVGVHLAIDVFQPKAVIFPIFGSLIDGTLVDDNIWLLGNSLWAFRIAHDVFTIALGDELESVKQYISEKFGDSFWIDWEKKTA